MSIGDSLKPSHALNKTKVNGAVRQVQTCAMETDELGAGLDPEEDLCSAPPTNRGVLNTGSESVGLPKTAQPAVIPSIDWISVTIPLPEDISDVEDRPTGDINRQREEVEYCRTLAAFLGLDWQEYDGIEQFKNREWSGAIGRANVRIMYCGRSSATVHLEATGQGCREIALSANFAGWAETLRRLLEIGGRFTRLDVAFDERSKLLDMEEIHWARTSGNYTCRARYYKRIESYDGLAEAGKTSYFGSPAGLVQVRIYDKAKQLKQDGHWIRCEIQARKEKAQQIAKRIVAENGVDSARAALMGWLRFTDPGDIDINKSRRKTATWWEKFLECSEGVALDTARKDEPSYEKSLAWLKKQVASTVARLERSGAASPENIREIFDRRKAQVYSGDKTAENKYAAEKKDDAKKNGGRG